MSNLNLKIQISSPRIEVPKSETLDQARRLAGDLDAAASRQLKSLRKEVKRSGIDLDGAERQLDKLGQQLRDASPLKTKVRVNRDSLELSGSLKLPTGQEPSRLQQDVLSEGPPRGAVFALNGFGGFIGGLVTGMAIVSGSGVKTLAAGGASALGVSTLAALSSQSLERQSGDEFESIRTLATAGAGYIGGLAVGIGLAHLAKGRPGGC